MVVDVLGRAANPPGAIALLGRDRVWTYGELAAAVEERARDLDAVGHGPGAVAPLVLESDAEGVITLFALWKVGATPAPLSSRLTEAERALAREALESVASGPQAVLWTSGTGGRSRGVSLSFAALEASARASAARLGLGAGDVWLASLSPAHVGGIALITRAVLLGECLVAVGAFDAEAASALVDGRDAPSGVPITHASLVPTQLLRLLDVRADEPPPKTFKCALIGGAGTPARLLARAIRGGWPLALTYGLTEATSQVATAPPALTRRKPGTVGRPLDGVEVSFTDDGEVLVRGATLANGYIAGDGPLLGADGWLHTGDLGHLDDEGDLWIVGRRADRIVTGGVTVDAAEVEEALRTHPLVRDAGVVGLPSEEWGERVGAWVEPTGASAAEESRGESLDGAVLDAYLRGRLSAPKLPRVYHVAPGLPRNTNGKLDRRRLKEVLARQGVGLVRVVPRGD